MSIPSVLREQRAEISGDIDHYIAVLAEDLYAASSDLKIVDTLRNVVRAADAERSARRGLGIGNPIDQAKLRDAYVSLLLERGRHWRSVRHAMAAVRPAPNPDPLQRPAPHRRTHS